MSMSDLSHALQAEYEELLRRGVPRIAAARLSFSIMHGNGNVILVVDEALSGLSESEVDSDLARALCESFQAVRVDGIAFVRTARSPLRMTYFDRDGTNASMCGNALRCVTEYGTEQGYLWTDEDVIMTDDGAKWVSAAGGAVRVSVGAGREFQRVAADRYFVFSGVAHLVVLLGDDEDLDAIDVRKAGAALRYDTGLCERLNHPEGLHVDFMQRHRDGIKIRTYEVGVEDETQACGTGSAGSAYVAHRVWGLPYPLRVTVRQGELMVAETGHGLIISGAVGRLFGHAANPKAANPKAANPKAANPKAAIREAAGAYGG
jgi:diaminopimelate epimerase